MSSYHNSIKDIVLEYNPYYDEDKYVKKLPLVKVLVNNGYDWIGFKVTDLMKILNLWIEGEELAYPLSKGYKGRWMLFEKICDVFGYEYIPKEVNKMDKKKVSEIANKIREFSSTEWFRAKEGKYKIVILGYLGEHKTEWEDGKPTIQHKFHISINQKMYNWSVSESLSSKGLFGQLMILADEREDNLGSADAFAGMVINLLVKGEGNNKDYTILEFVERYNSGDGC